MTFGPTLANPCSPLLKRVSPVPLTRRELVGAAAGFGAATTMARQALAEPSPAVRAIAFDAFPIFNATQLHAAVLVHYPDNGNALAASWLTRLFGLSWLLTAGGRYLPFEELAGIALDVVARESGQVISPTVRRELTRIFWQLNIWPDVPDALEQLRSRGVRLRFLSNLGEAQLEQNMRDNGIRHFFEPPLSTDQVRQFKPSPAAYRMANAAFGLPTAQIGFAAFGSWDAAGAANFGFPTAWVNRSGSVADAIGPAPAVTSAGIQGVLELVSGRLG